MTIVDERLGEIRGRADAATGGPWIAHTPMIHVDSWIEGAKMLDTFRTEVAHRVSDARDAAFIAHARTDVPALLAAVEAVLARCNAAITDTEPECDADYEDGLTDGMSIMAEGVVRDITSALGVE